MDVDAESSYYGESEQTRLSYRGKPFLCSYMMDKYSEKEVWVETHVLDDTVVNSDDDEEEGNE
jgi:hypothetical protein